MRAAARTCVKRRSAATLLGGLSAGATRLAVFLTLALPATSMPAAAQERDVPYWASLRSAQVNMHVGPSLSYRIAWTYRRQHLPVKVLRLKEGWRLVEDPDGARGWMLARFLSPDRWAMVRGAVPADMRGSGDADAQLLWRLAPGVVGKLGGCDAGWCALDLGDGHSGYVSDAHLWGTRF